MPQNKTNRRAAIYFPLSKGNQSKPGIHESSCGSRKPISTESLWSILTHPARQRHVSCSPCTSKIPIQAGLGATSICRGARKRSDGSGAVCLLRGCIAPALRGTKPLAQGSASTAQTPLRSRAFVCQLRSHFLHPGIPTPAQLSPGGRCQDAGRLCRQREPAGRAARSTDQEKLNTVCM